MSAVAGALNVIALVTSGLLAGGLVEVAAGEVPAFRRIDHGAYIRLHQLIDIHVHRYMPKMSISAALSGAVLAILRTGPLTRGLLVFAVAMTISVGVISELGNVPINRLIHGWQPENPPAEVPLALRRWARLHLVRTVAGVMALLSFAVATETAARML
jgi:hypothetical protein